MTWLADTACLTMCAAATFTDLRGWRIPNHLTFPGMAVGLALNFALATVEAGPVHGLSNGLVPAAAGGAALLVITAALAGAGTLGWGDVKLLAAVGALLRWPVALSALLYTILAGGVLAVVYGLWRGNLGAALSNLLPGRGRRGRSRIGSAASPPRHRMPYAMAILAGVAWVLAARHLPFLELI
jgi:prepilin peptidase CpaA